MNTVAALMEQLEKRGVLTQHIKASLQTYESMLQHERKLFVSAGIKHDIKPRFVTLSANSIICLGETFTLYIKPDVMVKPFLFNNGVITEGMEVGFTCMMFGEELMRAYMEEPTFRIRLNIDKDTKPASMHVIVNEITTRGLQENHTYNADIIAAFTAQVATDAAIKNREISILFSNKGETSTLMFRSFDTGIMLSIGSMFAFSLAGGAGTPLHFHELGRMAETLMEGQTERKEALIGVQSTVEIVYFREVFENEQEETNPCIHNVTCH